MTTPQPDIYTDCEQAMDALDAERISHGLTRGILICASQPEPAGEAVGVPEAVSIVTSAMREDLDYAWAWHCNIAMASVDEGLDHYRANKAAARFLSSLANVDTTQHAGFPNPPAAAPAPAVPEGWGIGITGGDEVVIESPGGIYGSMTLPNTAGEIGSLPVRLLDNLCRAMLAATPTPAPAQEVGLTQPDDMSDTDVARVFRRVYGGQRYDSTQREFASEIAYARDQQWIAALRAKEGK